MSSITKGVEGMKRNVIYILIAVFCLSVLSGCGGTATKTVQNGYLQFYPDLSIGEAVKKMEGSGIDTVWNKEKLQNGNTIVSLSFENEDFLEYTFDFLVKKKGEDFELRSIDIDGETVESQNRIIGSIKLVMENYGEAESLPVRIAKASETILFEDIDSRDMDSSDLYYLNPGVYDEINETYDYSKVQEALIDSTRMTLEEFGELGHVLTEKGFRNFLFQRLNRKIILEIKERVNGRANSVNDYVNTYINKNKKEGKNLSFHDYQSSEYHKEVAMSMINDIPNSVKIKSLDARRRILENKEYRSQVPLIKEVDVSWDWDYKEYSDEFLVYLFWDILYYKKLYDPYSSEDKEEEKNERTTFTFVIEKNEDNDSLVRGGTDVFQKVDYSFVGCYRIRIDTNEFILNQRSFSYSEGPWPYIMTILSYQAWKENGSPAEEMFDGEEYLNRMVESITEIVSDSWTNPSQQEDSTVSANTDTSETTEGFRTLVKADFLLLFYRRLNQLRS